MKKAIFILVIGLLWCSTSFAVVINYNCTVPAMKKIDYVNFQLDLDNKVMNSQWSHKGKVDSNQNEVRSIDNEKVVIYDREYKSLWWFYYATDQKAEGKSDDWVTYYDCSYDRSLVSSSINKSEKVEVASMIDKAKDTCKSLGFKEGTEKFADCSLKLYSQSLELAAEQNQTVVMQPQSSGSNKMTIYDPVRDSRALMKQGQRMLSGACTLGIDC